MTESITEMREERINVLQYFLPDALGKCGPNLQQSGEVKGKYCGFMIFQVKTYQVCRVCRVSDVDDGSADNLSLIVRASMKVTIVDRGEQLQ